MAAETKVIAGEDLGARRRRPLGVRRKGRRPRETYELMQAAGRLVKRVAIRMATEDPEQLVSLIALRAVVDVAIADSVRELREQGHTWQAIGEATGTTRQAAIMKWSPRRQGS